MRKGILIIAVAIVLKVLFLSGCQTDQTKVAAAPEVLAEFNFKGGMNHILLPVKMDGKEYQFALDTGASYTTFDDSLKDKLGKRVLWPKKAEAAHGKKIKVELFNAPNAFLGPFNLKDNYFVVVTDMNESVPDKIRNFQGVIGMDFLSKYIVQIDFENGNVKFIQGKKDFDLFSMFKPKENSHPEWGQPIQLKKKLLSDAIYAKVNLPGNITDDFMIDSGWLGPDTLNKSLFKNIPSSIDLGTNDENISSFNAVASNPDYKVLKRFSVGSLEYTNNAFLKNNISILTLSFLSRHLVTFDFSNKVMYLKKNKKINTQPQILIVLAQTGCIIKAENHEVFKVDPNSPAYEKGVRKKDILIKINDTDITSLNIMEFVKLSSQSFANGNKEFTFTFKRGDDIFTAMFVESGIKTGK